MKRLNNQAGFTLIELVVVIVILGILAATAAPKFIDLQDDAQTSTLQAVAGSMRSASSMVYSKSLIVGNQTSNAGATVDVNVNGSPVLIRYGYPRSNNAAAATSWQNNLLDLEATEFTVQRVGGSIQGVVVFPANKPVPNTIPADVDNPQPGESSCFTYYQETTTVGVDPVIVVVSC